LDPPTGLANPNNQFFNVSEYGIDLKLNIPRVFPFNRETSLKA
jgi:hypothetical protein